MRERQIAEMGMGMELQRSQGSRGSEYTLYDFRLTSFVSLYLFIHVFLAFLMASVD